MSSTARATTARAAAARPSSRPAARRSATRRPVLREVPAPAPAVAGTGMFSLIVLGVLISGMLVLLVLNTSLAQGAFELSSLGKQSNDLAVQEQRLLQQVAEAESPEALQARAAALGMVPVASPVFLRLSDGKVLGVPTAAVAGAPLLPTTGRPATSTLTTTTTTTRAAVATTAPARAAKPVGDAAVADPAPVDGAVPDAPVRAAR